MGMVQEQDLNKMSRIFYIKIFLTASYWIILKGLEAKKSSTDGGR